MNFDRWHFILLNERKKKTNKVYFKVIYTNEKAESNDCKVQKDLKVFLFVPISSSWNVAFDDETYSQNIHLNY